MKLRYSSSLTIPSQRFVGSNERIASSSSGQSRFIAMFSDLSSSEFLSIVLKARIPVKHIGNHKLQLVLYCHFQPNLMRLSKKIRFQTFRSQPDQFFGLRYLVVEAAIFISTPTNYVSGCTE